MELLAPAGSWESLHAAIRAGADSIYFGVPPLNMRVRASRSFHLSDIQKIASICRDQNVRSYLALNTLVYDRELPLLKDICIAAKEAGISAVIASDMAAIQAARQSDLEVHISTQMNISNLASVRFFAQFADVLVLARELSLPQIASICDSVQKEKICGPAGEPVRIELFVHGALCVAVSGICTMSLALTGHSANRGDCFQMCRRTYRVTDTETGQELDIDNQYIMSPKDLCTIGIMDRLIASGVSIFKIEGRARPADYVYHTTRVYRQAIDSVKDRNFSKDKINNWMEELKSVFNRGFWQNGYYLGKSLGEWSGAYGSRASKQKIHIGKVLNYYRKSGTVHIRVLSGPMREFETVAITGPTTGYVEFELKSLFVHDRSATVVKKEEEATFPCPEKVRPNDQVYVIRNRTDWQS
ncbi:U32 family peptidase [bacterium]|nr:U32 family peptidase [bacterium]